MDPFLVVAIISGLALAYANGANDVGRSVATLIGSGTTTYRKGILWGAIWTSLGAALAGWLAPKLLHTFVAGWFAAKPDTHPAFPLAVAGAAIGWVLFTARRGVPVSTTHSLVGAIVGLGLLTVGTSGIAWSNIILKVVVPLVVSPFLAAAATWLFFPLMQKVVSSDRELVLCVALRQPALQAVPVAIGSRLEMVATQTLPAPPPPAAELCVYVPTVMRVNANRLHWISSAAVAFARALNDTPKIAAIPAFLLLASGRSSTGTILMFTALAASMLAGSLLGGLHVTRRMAEDITHLNEGTGLTANVVTAFLVAWAANHGFPVSTTHVSNGSITGVGLARGIKAVSWDTIREFVLAWTVTLPISAALAVAIYTLLSLKGGM